MYRIAVMIASYLTTRSESKKHGGYEIYEDDKVKIMLDTYVPNVDIYVKDGPEKTLVFLYNGAHGFCQEYHTGKWEDYLRQLLPKAEYAKTEYEKREKERRESVEAKKNAPIDDAHIFKN